MDVTILVFIVFLIWRLGKLVTGQIDFMFRDIVKKLIALTWQ